MSHYLKQLLCGAGLLTLPLLFNPAPIRAADSKRPLAHEDFDGWRSISASPALSRDGRWLAYAFMPLEGDGEVVIRELATGQEQRAPVGALPPPPVTASDANPERAAPRREVAVSFTGDSRFLVATCFPPHAAVQQARRDKKKTDEMPKDGLVIINLASGEVETIDAVKSVQLSTKSEGGSWIAYLKEPAPEPKNMNKPANSPEKEAPSAPSSAEEEITAKPDKDEPPAGKSKKDRKYGSELVLRDLSGSGENASRSLPHVIDYSLARDGRTLVFAVSSPTETENGIFALAPGATIPLSLATGPGDYKKFTWDRTQTQAAFVTNRADPGAEVSRFALYHWKRGAGFATEIISGATPGMLEGHGVSGDTAPAFSFDGRKLIVPAAPPPKAPDERLASLPDEEKVALDIWHWRDDFVPPVQKQRADKERKRAYTGVFDLDSKKYVQLAGPELPVVTLTDDAARAVGWDDRAWRRHTDYDGVYNDIYLVSCDTGERQLIAPRLSDRFGVSWSHGGRWLAFFRGNHWFMVDGSDGTVRNLTESLPVAFFDELSDIPDAPVAYGLAGWVSDGDSLLVYDRYDLWQFFTDGRPPRNVTGGFGRAGNIQFRIQNIEAREPDSDRRGIDPSIPLVLRGEHETTRATGFFRTTFASAMPPERLLWGEKNYRYLGRALDADRLLLSASRFDEYPDLHITTTAFDTPAKVSDGGAQLAPFLWGGSELLAYRNSDGVKLPAALYKPANFDPAKKYPMIVYIYERLSQVVNNFYPPVPSTVINVAFYTSNGYLILTPDIIYADGHPGQSALKCVLPAVDEIVRRGYVDENAIGIQGHSWGGYQTAYIITQTPRFRAAEAGAIVSNMTSAYSGIRWGSGKPRQYQYEKAQSRIGAPLQEAPGLYLENSPVFFASRVQTPLLMLHNDLDGAVPWYQGIEFFLALRRTGKEVYLLNYNNEYHGLRRRADQKDFARRMSQFFDHHLKGAPRPAWMEKGVPYIEREEEALRFRGP